jgi:capsular polysaccharide biosynthesis protein
LSPDDAFDRSHGDERLLSQANFIRAIRRRLWLIALVAIVCVGAAAVYTHYWQTPTYSASIRILLGQDAQGTYTEQEQEREGEIYTNTTQSYQPPNLNTQIQGLREAAKTMAEAVKTRPVLEGVVQRLEDAEDPSMSPPKNLRGNLEAKQMGDTQFIQISYEDTSPERTQKVVDTVGDVFIERISEMSPSANSGITATVWERATLPANPVNMDRERNLVVALAVGLLLGVGLALLLDYFRGGWRSPEEAEQVSGVPTFGVIPAPSWLSQRDNRGVN